MIIYKITNKVTGKVYIGQTVKSLGHRKGQHITRCNLGERDHKLYLSMRKHGVENFEFSELCSVIQPEYLNQLETDFITEFNSYNVGYNMTCGGDHVSVEQRKKISATLMGHTHNKGKMPKGSAHPRSKRYLVRFPDGTENIVHGWKKFCRDNGLNEGTFSKTLTREDYTYSHKGYVLLEKFND